MIEVVGRVQNSYYCCAGFGTHSDWYRNVLKTPEVTIQVGRHRSPARCVPLTAENGERIMADYEARHPRVARRLCRLMGFAVDGSEGDFRAVGRAAPFMQFVPHI